MLINFEKLVQDMLVKQFTIAHLERRFKFAVIDTDKVGNRFREAVKKEYNAKFLDDSEYLIGFNEPVVQQDVEDEPEAEEEPETDDGSEEEVDDDAEDTEDAEEPDDGEEEEDGKDGGKEKKVQESKVRKLTSSMLKTEADTQASGDDLKQKIKKAVAYVFGISDNGKVELYDLPDFKKGYNMFFTKLSLKTKD